MLIKNLKKKKIVRLIISLLVVLIIGFTLTLILNKDIRTTISEKIKEIIEKNIIETKIDYEILPLERRKVKCIFKNRKPKWNRKNNIIRWYNIKL